MRLLALTAILPAGATFYFFVFWRWFDYWRRHRVQTYTLMLGTFVALGVTVHLGRDVVFAPRAVVPLAVQGIGWVLIAIVSMLGFVADRQIGLRVRLFTPFFEEHGTIELQTNGAYGVVRHPIYASAIGYQLGILLVTGYLAVAIALAVFALGAVWFTRQEERRLIALLADPAAYERYRARVPALLPRFGRAHET
jgi:protein-S-isoprenylcysteine O-methyltransferase Ste14